MLTHLDLHRGVTHATHTRRGYVVTRDTAPAERSTATTVDAADLAPGPGARLARPRERVASHLREFRDRWRRWTSLVAVAVRSVRDRLRDERSPHGDVRGAPDAAAADPPYPPDP